MQKYPDSNYNKVIRDAASVIVLRDSPGGPEVFMLQRPGRGDFPDLHVFPGGKVDAEDEELGQTIAPPQSANHPPQKFKAAALRECFEECGLLFAETPDGHLDAAVQQQFRDRLLANQVSLPEQFRTLNLKFQDDAVLYFSHWITPPYAPARFDTRFFVAAEPSDQVASYHESETRSGTWQTPETALAQFAAGNWQLIVPTITTLRMISGYENVEMLMETVRHGRHRIPVPQALHEKGMQRFVPNWHSF